MLRLNDRLTTFSDGGGIQGSFKEFYSPELILQNEDLSNIKRSFLDSFTKIDNNQFFIQLYDKRDDFPFSIVKMSHLKVNNLSKMFYSTHGSEVLRTASTSSSKLTFLNDSKKLIATMRYQGRRTKAFSHILPKVFRQHFQIFQKFFLTSSNSI